MRKKTGIHFLALMLTVMVALPASAVDAPKWVAALHIAAQNAVGLRWTPVPGATGYKVLRSTTPGSGYEEIAAPATPQYFDQAVEPGTRYYYVLQAVSGAEASPSSQEKNVAIPGEKKVEALLPPELNKITLTQSTEFGKTVSKVGVFWVAPKGKSIAYNLYRSETAGSGYSMLTSVNETQFVDTDIQVGKTYYYVITALDETFTETPHSAEKSILITEPKKRVAKERKEKILIRLRRTTPLGEIKSGSWGALVQPSSVAISSRKEIYVLDPSQAAVLVFGPPPALDFLFSFGEGGKEPGKFNRPLSMCISPDDEIYIPAKGAPRIDVFSDSGAYKRSVDLLKLMSDVDDPKSKEATMISCAEDAYFFAAPAVSRLYQVSYDDEVIYSMGGPGDEPGQFKTPNGTHFDPASGTVAVADMFNFRVQTIKDGEPQKAFGSYGNAAGQFARVIDVAHDEEGNIMTLDFMNSAISVFKPDGAFYYVIGLPDFTNQLPLTSPSSMKVDGTTLYVAEKLGAKVSIHRMEAEIERPKKGSKKKK